MDLIIYWSKFRLRMIIRCVAHKAYNAAEVYKHSIPTEEGLVYYERV